VVPVPVAYHPKFLIFFHLLCLRFVEPDEDNFCRLYTDTETSKVTCQQCKLGTGSICTVPVGILYSGISDSVPYRYAGVQIVKILFSARFYTIDRYGTYFFDTVPYQICYIGTGNGQFDVRNGLKLISHLFAEFRPRSASLNRVRHLNLVPGTYLIA
jgi:hypothetical protein